MPANCCDRAVHEVMIAKLRLEFSAILQLRRNHIMGEPTWHLSKDEQ
jgi:hypothetical protein